MKIGPHVIQDNSCFIIAEIGMNHNGIYENATKLIDQVAEMGIECAKFQLRHLDQVYTPQALEQQSNDLSTQYTLDLLKKFELTLDDYKSLKAYCESKGVLFMCTPWDVKSVDFLETLGVPGYKIASADFTNLELIGYVAKTGKPIILSTGMSSEDEIHSTVAFLKSIDANFALLHCNSTYPTPFKDVNLRYMDNLASHGAPYGYSGHERGIAISLAAVGRGAQILERHITLDRNMEGPDHAASLEFDDFNLMVQGVREIEQGLGQGGTRQISQGEMINRDNIGKSMYLTRDIAQGETITEEDIIIRSPGRGLSPQYLDQIINTPAKRALKAGDCLFKTDLEGEQDEQKAFSFKHQWGIAVRPHDMSSFLSQSKPDFVEFHFSYRDLDEPIENYMKEPFDGDYIVHVPELFSGDHLLDLCTHDDAYRAISIQHMKDIVQLTLKLKPYFKKATIPKVVIHCGGFTKDAPFPVSERPSYYANLKASLDEIDHPGIQLLPENMAPFPWHFGGQRHQNIFVDAHEIAQFCEETGYRICQDVSHSHLACNHFGWDHVEYTRTLAPYTDHYHISDGEGVDGEGLQVGEGTIQFDKLCPIINNLSANATFIPEVWQGHKNNGQGFWTSLKELETHL